jgi:hypothetical protein
VGDGRGRGMTRVELYAQVRCAVRIEGISRREAARRFGIDPRTVAKMLAFSVPPGYRRSRPPARPKLDLFTGIIDAILASDEGRAKKQRHAAKRIFERLREEHGYAGGITVVKDYVRGHRLQHREVFVPLRHDPGHAQVDFGEALAEIAGVERKIHFFALDLRHSDACFVRAYPAEPAKRFATGTTPRSASSARRRSRSFTIIRAWRWRGSWVTGCASARGCSASCSRITCLPIGSVGPASNDKGKVEGLIGWARRNLLLAGVIRRRRQVVEVSTARRSLRSTRRWSWSSLAASTLRAARTSSRSATAAPARRILPWDWGWPPARRACRSASPPPPPWSTS